jgi:hypothetical protein
MITEPDGFKHVEGHDSEREGIHATYDNTVLLHEQVKELRVLLNELLWKLERVKTDEH